MNNDFRDKIIVPSWNAIKDDSKIKIFYFFPGIISIIFLSILLVYQSIYTYIVIFGNKEKALESLLNFVHSTYFIEIIVGAVIFLIFYFIAIPIFESTLIKYIDNKNIKGNDSISYSFGEGILKFFPVFEFNNVFGELKVVSIINGYLFMIRFIPEYIKYVTYIFLIILFISFFVNILLAYSKYEIVIGNKDVFPSIRISARIAIMNLKTTIKLYFLMFIFNFRVVFNFLVFLIFPILVFAILSYITSKIFLTISLTIIIIVFILFVLLLGYLTAVLDVFTTSIWYFAYIEGRKKLDEIEGDVISKENNI